MAEVAWPTRAPPRKPTIGMAVITVGVSVSLDELAIGSSTSWRPRLVSQRAHDASGVAEGYHAGGTHRLRRPCYLAIRLCVLDSGWQRTGGARDQQGHCLQRGNDKESVQDSDPVADKANEWRPGEGREFADG